MAQAMGRDPLKKQKDSLNFKNSAVQRLARGAGRYAADMLAGGPAVALAKGIGRAYVASEGKPFSSKNPRYVKDRSGKNMFCTRNCGEDWKTHKRTSHYGLTKEQYGRKLKKISLGAGGK
jgi:hypothetical protein